MVTANKTGFYPYTPAMHLLFALREALDMMAEEGLSNVYARHARYAHATRLAAAGWGLELQCSDPAAYAPGVTAIRVPDGHSADKLRTSPESSVPCAVRGARSRCTGSGT